MTAWSEALVTTIAVDLATAADPAKAAAMRAYMKDHFEYFGVASPERKAILKTGVSAVGQPTSQADLVDLARSCWTAEERELQYVACDLLERHTKLCDATFLPVAEELIRSKSWWDTVDALAAHVVGPLVRRHPELVETMDRWIHDDDFWIARTAILHQLQYKQATDTDRLFRYCLARRADKEFFIRKAIGWALRQYAWTDPVAIRDFLDANGDQLSPLSVREASKNLAKLLP